MWHSVLQRLARRGLGIGLLSSSFMAIAAVGPAWGQAVKYQQFRRPAGFDVAKQAAVQEQLAAGTVANDKDLQDFFVAKFADLTNPAKDKDIHKSRAEIKKQLQTAGNAPVAAAHDKANAFLIQHLPSMIAGAKGNLHPTVRYNLALLLADLDSVERKGQANPVPLPEARGELLKLLANAKLHDSIRLAALIGVSRHAALVNEAASRVEIAQGVLAYLDELSKADDAARKHDVKYWLESRAMETLGATETPTPEIVAALQARLVDVNRPIWVRTSAAVALGKLKYEPGAQVDMPGLIAGYTSLLETAVEQGVTRRELREVVFSVKRGIAGFSDPAPNALVTLMDDAQKRQSAQMVNAMSKMAEACENKDHPTEARVAIAVKEIVQKWRAGEFPDTLDADAKKNLSEDQTSGEGESEGEADGEAEGDGEGVDFNLDAAPAE